MRVIMLFVAVAAIYVYFNGMPGGNGPGAFDESGQPTVQVFTFPDCGKACDSTLQSLRKRKVEFVHHVVDHNDQESEAYKLWSDYRIKSFPLVVAGNEKLGNSSNAQLAMILGKTFDTEYLTYREKKYYAKHFADDGSPKIVLYGTDWCPGCAQLRKEFKEMNVDFVDIDVEKPRLNKTLLKDLEIRGYPATWVGYTRINSTKASVIVDALEDY